MCPPLFSEATTFDSILVSDHYSLAFWVVAYERFDFYCNALSTSRRVIFIKVWSENDTFLKKATEKGQKSRFTYTSQGELRKWVPQNLTSSLQYSLHRVDA